MNTPTRTLADIEHHLRKKALKLLKGAGYNVSEDGLKLRLDVSGYEHRYDGWRTDITPTQWGEIMSLDWNPAEMRLFELLHSRDNAPLTASEVKACEMEREWICQRRLLSRFHDTAYHFPSIENLSHKARNGKKDVPHFRVFIRPNGESQNNR